MQYNGKTTQATIVDEVCIVISFENMRKIDMESTVPGMPLRRVGFD